MKVHCRPAGHGHKERGPYGLCGWRGVRRGAVSTVAITDDPAAVTCKRCLAKLAALGGSMRRKV